jgi:hypothetical protein
MEALTLKSQLTLVVICFVIFLLLREVNLWYWKINRRIELQEETNRLLKQMLETPNDKYEVKHTKNIDPDIEPTSVNNPEVLEELINRLKNK